MLVSICIPTRDRVNSLQRTIGSVLENDYTGFEIIVIDNGRDDTYLINQSILQRLPFVKHIRASHHMGIAALRQLAVDNSTGEIIAFLDDDIKVPHDWLTAIVKHFSTNSNLGIYGCLVEFFDQEGRLETPAIPYGRKMGTNGSLKLTEIIDEMITFGECNLVLRKTFLQEVGGFDLRFKWGHEGADLTYRILLAGRKLYQNDAMAMKHYASSTSREFDRHFPDYYRLLFYFKYFEINKFNLFYELIRIFYALRRGEIVQAIKHVLTLWILPIIAIRAKRKQQS